MTGSHCGAILANYTPWIALNVCFNRHENGRNMSVIATCINSDAVKIEIYEDENCRGNVQNETIQYQDAEQLDCYADSCDYAIIRQYDDINCQPIGDYTEFPFPVNKCFSMPHLDEYFGSVKCKCIEDVGVYLQYYAKSNYDCTDSRLKTEHIAWNRSGHCNLDNHWTEFIRCSTANEIKISLQSSSVIFVLCIVIKNVLFL